MQLFWINIIRPQFLYILFYRFYNLESMVGGRNKKKKEEEKKKSFCSLFFGELWQFIACFMTKVFKYVYFIYIIKACYQIRRIYAISMLRIY